MQTATVILFGLAILAIALTKSPNRTKPAWSQQLQGWQNVFGVVAVVLAILIVASPEFLALGIVGDTAFFDLLVLSLSLQMHTLVARAGRRCIAAVASGWRWLWTPSPGFIYLRTVSTFAIACIVIALQKAVHRITS